MISLNWHLKSTFLLKAVSVFFFVVVVVWLLLLIGLAITPSSCFNFEVVLGRRGHEFSSALLVDDFCVFLDADCDELILSRLMSILGDTWVWQNVDDGFRLELFLNACNGEEYLWLLLSRIRFLFGNFRTGVKQELSASLVESSSSN